MKLLLDTHVVLWSLADPASVRAQARACIVDPNNIVFVSAVSAWEIELKRALNKLDAPDDLEEQLPLRRFTELPLRLRHTRVLASLPEVHRDPFDRMLVAQAIADDLTIITRDQYIPKYPVKTLRA